MVRNQINLTFHYLSNLAVSCRESIQWNKYTRPDENIAEEPYGMFFGGVENSGIFLQYLL